MPAEGRSERGAPARAVRSRVWGCVADRGAAGRGGFAGRPSGSVRADRPAPRPPDARTTAADGAARWVQRCEVADRAARESWIVTTVIRTRERVLGGSSSSRMSRSRSPAAAGATTTFATGFRTPREGFLARPALPRAPAALVHTRRGWRRAVPQSTRGPVAQGSHRGALRTLASPPAYHTYSRPTCARKFDRFRSVKSNRVTCS